MKTVKLRLHVDCVKMHQRLDVCVLAKRQHMGTLMQAIFPSFMDIKNKAICSGGTLPAD